MKKSLLIAMTVFLSTSVFAVDGYKDAKFGMSWEQIKAKGFCEEYGENNPFDIKVFGGSCYKVAGKKRLMGFYFPTGKKKSLNMIHIVMGDSTTEYFNKLVKGIGKKYKETYRLTREQIFTLNEGNKIVFFGDNKITLREVDKGLHLFYTKDVSPLYKQFAPTEDVSSDDF
tara:strand:- start:27 stop:539 length:513 start_codon:yes stop_codon:yes gene_type:complete